MNERNRITQVVCLAMATQLLAMVLLESVWSVVGPPLAAALPVAVLTARSPETIEAIAPKLPQYHVGFALVGIAVMASFAWSGSLSFELQLLRAIGVDVAILCLASTMAVQAVTMRQGS